MRLVSSSVSGRPMMVSPLYLLFLDPLQVERDPLTGPGFPDVFVVRLDRSDPGLFPVGVDFCLFARADSAGNTGARHDSPEAFYREHPVHGKPEDAFPRPFVDLRRVPLYLLS